MKTLLIDDMRDLGCDFNARTYLAGIEALKHKGWDILFLDHDLGEEKSGYDILCWLEENPQYLPRKIEIITMNPVGREKMTKLVTRLYSKPKYIHWKWTIGLFHFSFYKLNEKLTIRFELSKGWE